MRLISLNIWGGRTFEALAGFLREHASTADVFCFQEVCAEAPRGRAMGVDETVTGSTPATLSRAAPRGEAISGGLPSSARTQADIGPARPTVAARWRPAGGPPIPRADSAHGHEQGEARHRLSWSRLAALLPEFLGAFAPMERFPTPDGALELGLATFVRRGQEIRAWGQAPILSHDEAFTGDGWQSLGVRPLQYCRLTFGGREVVVANFHGTPIPGSKLDTPERLAQSRRIRDALQAEAGEVVLAGDFNLLPDTASIALLERHWRNLVREYGIATTRSPLNEYYGTPEEQKYADYAFVSSGIAVHGFAVPDVAVSDHLPLIVDFT